MSKALSASATFEAAIARIAALEARPTVGPPQNLAPNSQWEIMSGQSYETRYNSLGTGTLGVVSIASNTVGSNSVTLTYTGSTAGWKVGDLIKISGHPDAALNAFPMRIRALTASTIDVITPRGAQVASSGTGTIRPVNIGCLASVGTGDAADGWKKSLETIIWREDNAVNIPAGARYSLGCKKGTSGQEVITTHLDLTLWHGRKVSFGIYVKASAADWSVYANSDGTGGTVSSVATNAATGWLEISYTVPLDATYIDVGVLLNGASGATYYLSNPVVAAGSRIGSDGYTKPQESFIPLVKVEPAPWINAAITFSASLTTGLGYCWAYDLYADSGGQVAPSVKLAVGNLEGINTNPVVTGIGGSRLIAFTDKIVDPIKLGPFMSQQVQNVKNHIGIRLPLENGGGYMCSGVASDSWGNVSMDLDLFYLS